MKKLLLFASILSFLLAQTTLRQQMWQMAFPQIDLPKKLPQKITFFEIEMLEGEEIVIFHTDKSYEGEMQIDDSSKNGYLHISNGLCCKQERTVAAYKNTQNKYAIISQYHNDCDNSHEIVSNMDPRKILPKKLLTIISKNQSPYASFYLSLNLPKKGTDTKVYIKQIPLGLLVKSQNAITISISTQRSQQKELQAIKKIAQKIKDKQTITHLLNKDYKSIDNTDLKIIDETILAYKTTVVNPTINNKDDLCVALKELNQIYKTQLQNKYKSFILKWDRKKTKFLIKHETLLPKNEQSKSFIDFLKDSQYFDATKC